MIPTSPFWQESILGVAQSNRLVSEPVQVDANLSVSKKQPCWNYSFGRPSWTAYPLLCPMRLQATSASYPLKLSAQTLYQVPFHSTSSLPRTILDFCSASRAVARPSLGFRQVAIPLAQMFTTCSFLRLFGYYEHPSFISTWELPAVATNSVLVYDCTCASPPEASVNSTLFLHPLSHYVNVMGQRMQK